MGKPLNLTGERFGRLIVISRSSNDRFGRTHWICRCDCGIKVEVSSNNLRRRNTKSCGCYKRDVASNRYIVNLIGKRFSRLIVIDRAKNKGARVYWLCKCDCGNEVEVSSSNLRSGHVKSCGCYRLESLKKRAIDLTGKRFGRLMVICRVDNRGKDLFWLCKCDCGNEKEIDGNNLESGNTTSCGCYFKEFMEKIWEDPEYIKKQIKSRHIKPNKLELKFESWLNENFPNEWKYVGDFEFWLGGKNPDFMNINGQKKLIELYGDYWHKNDNPQDRIDYFNQYGFDTLVIWENELKDLNTVKNKIKYW